MKRKIAWLALPLVLAALMLGVKWRAEHPPVTKEDLAIRALMSQCSTVTVEEGLPNESRLEPYGTLSKVEIKHFIDSLHSIPQQSTPQNWPTGANGIIYVKFLFKQAREDSVTSIDVSLNFGASLCFIVILHPGRGNEFTQCRVHPVTVKRWMELLMSNPDISSFIRSNKQ